MRNTLDTNEFKNLFPIYWKYRGNEADHHEMAEKYLNSMANFLKTMNPRLSESVAKALAWGGLNKTEMWGALGDSEKNQILIINNISSNPTQNQADSLNLKKCLN